MKKAIFPLLLTALALSSCSDFFEPETSDALSGDDYMSDLNEMATGYLGVLTKMQAAGDKEIYLTDTRAEMLEPTSQSTAELIALYNYEDNLSGNSYADPALYYDVVIACNDYIQNMIEFNTAHPELIAQTDYFPGLLASALRVKVWAYVTLGEIYGQALWFDDPIVKMQDVSNSSVFTLLPMEQILDRCIAILENGYQGFSAKENFSWVAWIDPENVTNIANSTYRYWDQMTPPYEALLAKCKIWSAAYKERNGQNAEGDYQAVLDQLLPFLDNEWQSFHHYWKRAGRTPTVYNNMYNYATPNQEESVSAIIYDYTKNQTNRLLYHFSNEYPNAYLLTTNEAARLRFEDNEFDPLGTQTIDQRLGRTTKENGSIWYVSKFRPIGSTVRTNAYQDDVHVYTFRAAELFLWLAEACNHLQRFEAMDRLINQGFTSAQYEMLQAIQEGVDSLYTEKQLFNYRGFTTEWACPSSTDRYGMYTGFRTCLTLADVDLWDETKLQEGYTLQQIMRHNDELIRNEWILEFPVEGKTYPAMNRFAEHYNDPSFVSDIVRVKYEARGMADQITSKIHAQSPITGLPGYWVPWDLQVR